MCRRVVAGPCIIGLYKAKCAGIVGFVMAAEAIFCYNIK
jgi:hypothetical protein